MPGYIRSWGYLPLTPAYGLGSYGRTAGALLISSPRNKIGSQGRIYAWMKNHQQGPQYIKLLIEALGPGGRRGTNLFSVI